MGGGGHALLKRCKDVLLPVQNGPHLGDQFLKRAQLHNDKTKTKLFHYIFFLGLEDGLRYWRRGGERGGGGQYWGLYL